MRVVERDPRDPLDGNYEPIPYRPPRPAPEDALARSRAFRDLMAGRRSVRMFSRDPVPAELIDNAVATAATAPSGAHAQPWTFVVISDADLKAEIRLAAEEEERRSYARRMPDEWVRALRRLGTDEIKTHLTDAPYVIVVFAQASYLGPDGYRRKHYYVAESVGIACGLLLAALHAAGLAALVHTPSPMRFLTEILGRPANERPFVVIPVGWPADDAVVPDLERKPLEQVLVRPERQPVELRAGQASRPVTSSAAASSRPDRTSSTADSISGDR